MLPNSVIIIPRYVLFNKFGWVDSYMPFWVPAPAGLLPILHLSAHPVHARHPRDLDESACIDGCGSFRIFWQILLPLMKPALFSAGLFQFLWTYNDYFNSLIFINSVKNTPSRWRCAFPLTRKVLWCGAALWPWPAWRFCRWFSSFCRTEIFCGRHCNLRPERLIFVFLFLFVSAPKATPHNSRLAA